MVGRDGKSTVTIRVQVKTLDRLQRLTKARKQSVSTIVGPAVSQYDDAIFWADYREKIEAIRAKPARWSAFQDEVKRFERNVLDGLRAEPAP